MIEHKDLPFMKDETRGMLNIKYNSGLFESLYKSNERSKQSRKEFIKRQQKIFQNNSGYVYSNRNNSKNGKTTCKKANIIF